MHVYLLAANLRVLTTPIRFSSLLERLTEVRKALQLGLEFYSKKYPSELAKGREAEVEVGRVPRVKLPLSFLCGVKIHQLPDASTYDNTSRPLAAGKLTQGSLPKSFIT